MSKRLQVMLPEAEYESLSKAARRSKISVSELVRQSIRLVLSRSRVRSAEEKTAAVMKFARFSGPTGTIEEILAQIDRGRDLN